MPLNGWYEQRGQWRKRGADQAGILLAKGFDDVDAASRAEGSGRLRGKDDVKARMLQYQIDMAHNAMEWLISEITDDPLRRSACGGTPSGSRRTWRGTIRRQSRGSWPDKSRPAI